MQRALHETCQQYVARRLSEGWRIVKQEGFNVILMSPDGMVRPVDLRNDIETLRPNAPGDECNIDGETGADCPDHYLNVDETPPDEAVTQVYTKYEWRRDLYNIDDRSVGSGSINSITVYCRCRGNINADYDNFKIAIKTGGAAFDADKRTTLAWITYSHEWAQNPDTVDDWTWAEIDALQIGVEMRHPIQAGGGYTNCTQMYVEVDYTVYTRTWGIDAAFKALGIEEARGFDAAFQIQDIQKARGYDAAFQATFEKTPDIDAAFKALGIEEARGFDAFFALFEATTWYAKLRITDLDSVVHDITPGVLGEGDALTLSLEHLKADGFFFSVEDYAGDKRDWLVRGCMVEIFIDRFKPPTTRRFYGMVEELNEDWSMPTAVVVKVRGRDKFSIYLDRKVTETYLDTEVSVIVKDLLDKYAPDLDQTNIDVTTTTLEDARFPYRSLKEILDYLGKVSGYTYRCDAYLDFYWKQASSEDTGIKYTNMDISSSPAKLSSLHSIKNRIYVLGGEYMEIDQEQTTVAATKNLKDKWYAQSFTPDRSGLDQLSLHLKRTGDPASLEGEIRNDDAGDPGDVIATFSIDKDFIGTSASWRPVRVEATLILGVKYWIVLKKVDPPDAANTYEWSDDNDNAGENADSDDGVAWNVRANSYQMAFKIHFAVPIIAVKQDYASRDNFMWREEVHEDKAIMSRVVARQTAQALLDELKDETPSIKPLRTINQTSIPDRGKLVTVTLAPLKIAAVPYEVKRVFFNFKGGEDGTDHMDVFVGRSIEEIDEWINRLRLDIDRAKIGSFGVAEGVINLVEILSDTAEATDDNLVATVQLTGTFLIDTARIGFSDIG